MGKAPFGNVPGRFAGIARQLGGVVAAIALILVVCGLPGALASAAEKRTDARWLLALQPTGQVVDDFLLTFEDTIRPGEPFVFPVAPIEEIVESRRFVAAAMIGFESIDQRVSFIITFIDVGDPLVYSNIDLEGWRPATTSTLPEGTLLSPIDKSDEPYPEITMAWSNGPILVVLNSINLSQAIDRSEIIHTLGPVMTQIADDVPSVGLMPPARPATPYVEGISVGKAVATLVFSLVLFRWLLTAFFDPASRARIRARLTRKLRRTPVESSSRVVDVSSKAIAFLWSTRLVTGFQLLTFLFLVAICGMTYVLLDAGWPIRPLPAMVLLGAFSALWLVAPKLTGVTCWLFSRRSYRPKVLSSRRGAGRWLRNPGHGAIVLLGLLASVVVAAVGFSLLYRAATTEVGGSGGGVGQERVEDVRNAFVSLGVLSLAISTLPFTFARRVAYRSARISLGGDARPPILLLRSFSDDALAMRAHRTSRHFVLSRLQLSTKDRFEEILVWALWRWGPVTTLGQPGSRLPPLGASREYYADDDWKKGVAQLISSASLIVVVIDRTDSLRWEIAEISRQVAMQRCMFVIPPVASDERTERVFRWEELMGRYGTLPLVDPGREVLVTDLNSENKIRAYTSSFRDSLSYEVAVDIAAGANLSDDRIADGVRPKLERPAPRGSRPKGRSERTRWGLVAAVWTVVVALNLLSPEADIPESPQPDRVIELSSSVHRTQVEEYGNLVVPAGRGEVVFAQRGTRDIWTYQVPSTDRVRAVSLGEELTVFSTLETSDLVLLRTKTGEVIHRVDISDSASALVQLQGLVVAARPESQDVVVVDSRGKIVKRVAAAGIPTQLAVTDTRVIVGGTQGIRVIDLPDFTARSIPLPGAQGLATSSSKGFVLLGEREEVVEVDLDSGRIIDRRRVSGVVPLLSNFDPALAANGNFLAAPIRRTDGGSGIVVLEVETLSVERRIWTYTVGVPHTFFFWDGFLYMGTLETPGILGWSFT